MKLIGAILVGMMAATTAHQAELKLRNMRATDLHVSLLVSIGAAESVV
jgi:hypothetical protein